ncbi:MAG: hypothetical protein Pars2KO_06280 [Parasphingorhabdus sp.]
MRVKALRNSDKALDESALEAFALRYVSRYATTRHKLKNYLIRKLREKGGPDRLEAAIDNIVNKYAEMGYIDDALFAQSRASALLRKGYGKRRIMHALKQAGIAEVDQEQARQLSEEGHWQAAQKFAQKRRIGPYASEQHDRKQCQKLLQAFLRAGHDYEIAAKYVFAKPGETIDLDI